MQDGLFPAIIGHDLEFLSHPKISHTTTQKKKKMSWWFCKTDVWVCVRKGQICDE
jgi:hypothetical protein